MYLWSLLEYFHSMLQSQRFTSDASVVFLLLTWDRSDEHPPSFWSRFTGAISAQPGRATRTIFVYSPSVDLAGKEKEKKKQILNSRQ
jgi:hypothetical protein